MPRGSHGVVDGTPLTLSGFGGVPNNSNNSAANCLGASDLETTGFPRCKRIMEGRIESDSQACAAPLGEAAQSCVGNYGSPVVIKGTNQLYGIVSQRGTSCTEPGTPSHRVARQLMCA